MGSLQDALLKAGLAEEKPRQPRAAHKARAGHPSGGKGKSQGQVKGRKRSGDPRRAAGTSDLERAYKARERAEAQEKEQAKQAKLAAQEARRKRNLELDAIVRGQTLNRKEADCPRYFEHLGRIRRVMCTPQQREQLNAAELGLVALRGSYLLVTLEIMAAFRAVAPDLVPDLTPREPEDDGSDYPPVPDDLVW